MHANYYAILNGNPPNACKKCGWFGYIDYFEDILDWHEENLIQKYKQILAE